MNKFYVISPLILCAVFGFFYYGFIQQQDVKIAAEKAKKEQVAAEEKKKKLLSGRNYDILGEVQLNYFNYKKSIQVLMKDFKDLDSVDEDKLVEEANLLYVAITRAKYEVSFLSDEDEW